MTPTYRFATSLLLLAGCTSACSRPTTAPSKGSPKVGPPHGSVIVVGGGGQGPEVFAKLIELAGGPDALILDVPTAGGDSVYAPDWRGQSGLKAAGAKNIFVLHTSDRKVANSDAFVEPIKRAGGIWYEGGRHFHLVDSYLGTKTERELAAVLERGGVASGSSAGASILGSFLVRGAPSNNNNIMAYPGYLKGFAYLRGVGIDQHVVARERLADLADSLMKKYPDSLFISEDEGTAWVVQGDVAEIIGRNKAFVYNGKDATDHGKPFLTLHPGDKYDLAARHVVHRAIEESKLSQKFIDGVFADFRKPGGPKATVVVAQNGKVFVNAAYNVPPQAKYMPETTVPNFALGDVSDVLSASMLMASLRSGGGGRGGRGGAGGRGGRGAAAGADTTPPPPPAAPLKLSDKLASGVTIAEYLSHSRAVANGAREFANLIAKNGGSTYAQLANTRIYTPVGMHKTTVDSSGAFKSNVDELYRFELGLTANKSLTEADSINVFVAVAGSIHEGLHQALGWYVDNYKGFARQYAYGTSDGKRAAFVRFPERKAAIIILTDSDNADARKMANAIADRLLAGSSPKK
jgi:cyanophycinase